MVEPKYKNLLLSEDSVTKKKLNGKLQMQMQMIME